MTQKEAQKIVGNKNFKYKDNFNINLNMREFGFLFSLIHRYYQDKELRKYTIKEMKNNTKSKNTPKTLDEEANILINKLCEKAFTRDPEKIKIMAIADGNKL